MTTYRLWPATNGPGTATSFGSSFISGMVFCVTSEAWFEGYWWWVCPSGGQPTTPTKCALWQIPPSNAVSPQVVPGSVVVSGTLTAGQWNFIPLATPILLSVGGSSGMTPTITGVGSAQYVAAIGCNGSFPDTNNYWGAGQVAPNGITSGPLTAYSAVGGGMPAAYVNWPQGCFQTAGPDPATTTPNQASGTDNFWVDVQVSDYSGAPAGAPLRLWPNFPAPVVGANDDNTKAVSGTAFTLSQSCKLGKILMYNPTGSTGLPSRCGIWNTNTKAIVSGTDSGASPAWLVAQPQSFWGESVTVAYHSDGVSYTLGNEFSLAATSLVTAIRWYSPAGSTALPAACAIWNVGTASIVPGTQVNSPAWVTADGGATPAAPGSGWMKCVLPAPVSLTGSTSYVNSVLLTGASGYPEAGGSFPITAGSITVAGFAFIAASSLTYPSTQGNTACFGIDLDIQVPAVAGSGWIYVDYSAAGITLPAGSYATSFYDSAGVLFYDDSANYFFAGTDPKGGGTVGGAGHAGISTGGGILTAPNLAGGPSLAYDDLSGTFPGQGSYQPGPSGWVYPGEFEASTDWGETRWADVEVTPASSAAGVASLAGHGTLAAAALSLVPGHASQAGAGVLSAHARLRSPSSMAGHGTLAALGAVTRFSGFSSAGGGGSMSAVATVRAPQAAVPPPPRRNPPLWTRDVQPWAIAQERIRHDEALYQIGELTMFALMWHLEDFQATLVGRCQTCFVAEGTISDAYGQGNQYRCPDCFGTTFEGGFKAMIVRPAIFRDLDKNQTRQARGVTNMASTSIESTADFRVRTGDYCLRQTGDRFFLRVPRRTTLRTGFSSPWQAETAIDYVHANAVVQDPTSPAYIIFPDGSRLLRILQDPARLPVDITDFDPTEQGLP